MIDDAAAAIRFRIGGMMRFLSHAETARLWQRACDRAGLGVRYSEGFNPHPRLSLPLPRPVGVAAADELLVARLYDDRDRALGQSRAERETAMKQALAAQLPEGMEVRAVDLVSARATFRPRSAEYVFPVRVDEEPSPEKRLTDRMVEVMESECCMVERTSAEGRATRAVDVRPFLSSIRWEGGNLIVRHRTGGTGSIRVDEIMQLFGLRAQDLAGPVRRTNVIWETTKLQNSSKGPCMETRAEDMENGT